MNLTELKQQIAALPAGETLSNEWCGKYYFTATDLQALATSHDELLAAAKAAVAFFHHYSDEQVEIMGNPECQGLQAAISKAEGQDENN